MLILVKFNMLFWKWLWSNCQIFDMACVWIRHRIRLQVYEYLRMSVRYWSSHDYVANIYIYILDALAFYSKFCKHWTEGKWSEIPLRGKELEISMCLFFAWAKCRYNEVQYCKVLRKQATGLDAWASRVKCPARFVSHLHKICTVKSLI